MHYPIKLTISTKYNILYDIRCSSNAKLLQVNKMLTIITFKQPPSEQITPAEQHEDFVKYFILHTDEQWINNFENI